MEDKCRGCNQTISQCPHEDVAQYLVEVEINNNSHSGQKTTAADNLQARAAVRPQRSEGGPSGIEGAASNFGSGSKKQINVAGGAVGAVSLP